MVSIYTISKLNIYCCVERSEYYLCRSACNSDAQLSIDMYSGGVILSPVNGTKRKKITWAMTRKWHNTNQTLSLKQNLWNNWYYNSRFYWKVDTPICHLNDIWSRSAHDLLHHVHNRCELPVLGMKNIHFLQGSLESFLHPQIYLPCVQYHTGCDIDEHRQPENDEHLLCYAEVVHRGSLLI